ncbi:MAG: DUF956 family protein, partial [Eubacteriales bacterium]|nr:DUF956 family protein [Eubacteriales bacterium]
MVQSLNSKVDLVIKGTFYGIFPDYGQIMIGNAGFEFYSNSNPEKCIQIRWEAIDSIIASVKFNGKWIPRFAVCIKNNTYYFSSKDNKKVLRAINKYIPADKMFKALSTF